MRETFSKEQGTRAVKNWSKGLEGINKAQSVGIQGDGMREGINQGVYAEP